jgi:hypothetical protein
MAKQSAGQTWGYAVMVVAIIVSGVLWLNYTPLGQMVNWLISPH